MKIGNRVYHNQDGMILFTAGEMENGPPRLKEEKVEWIDLEYGSIDYKKQRLVAVDIETKEPILETIITETEEEKRIRELEDALLLATENEIGGIL